MIWYLIKNNFKLMLRNKIILICVVFGPVLVIAVLSSAFESLMKSYETTDRFKAGYRVEKGSFWEEYVEIIKEAGKDAGIQFLEYPEGKPEEIVENNGLSCFAELGSREYKVYKSADNETEGVTLEYFLVWCLDQSLDQALIMSVHADISNKEDIEIPVQKLDYMPAVDAKDYYGIIEIVYFSFLGIICIASILSSEKKNGIGQRLQITSLSSFKLYFAKWIPLVSFMAFGIGVSVLVSSFMFGIHWGNLALSVILVLLVIMAGASLGLMYYSIFKNLAVTVIILFTITWFMGFFGGSFETYMFSSFPETVKRISPIYHVNRALIEYSCMGHSTYTLNSIFYLLAIIAAGTGIAVLTDWIRKKGKEKG